MSANTRKKIFYVDDMPSNLVSLKSRLDAYYEVYPFPCFDKMFKFMQNIRPDLIILDVNMPEISGFDGIECLKKDPSFKNIPVIFLTSEDGIESSMKGHNFGAADYISKSSLSLSLSKDSDLIKRIERQLEKNN
ncbi:MAG: response regulator [Chitinivibrionia bacterium]|nr:response regulator [Chitinivibrionia bacterium]